MRKGGSMGPRVGMIFNAGGALITGHTIVVACFLRKRA